MDGVLENTVALCGWKVLCSILCLPSSNQSISSVSLCCCCLLLFTDLSITVFLAYLWYSSPSSVSVHLSPDDIALRFLLFLSKTYEAVLMLTPVLVAVEVLVRLLWHQEATMSKNAIGQSVKTNKNSKLKPVVLPLDAEEEAREMEGLQNRKNQQIRTKNQEIFFELLKVASFLCCLLLWCVSANYAESIWKQDLPMVRECLDKGGSLSACLPCLLTASLPIGGEILWLVAAIMVVLLGLMEGLAFVFSKLTQFPELIFLFLGNQLNTFQGKGSACGRSLRTFCSKCRKCVQDHQQSESNRSQEKKKLWNSVLDLTPEPNNDTINSAAQSPQLESNKKPLANGNPVPLSCQTGLAEECKLQGKGTLQRSAAELPLMDFDVLESQRSDLHPLESSLGNPRWEIPSPRRALMTGLVCGLLVCVLPTVLSTNILLVRSLDTLAVCVVKYLLIATHSK